MDDKQTPLDQAFMQIRQILEEKDAQILALKKENTILQKEYDRVCQMLSAKEDNKAKTKGFFARFFDDNQEDQVIPVKDTSQEDLVLESFKDPKRTWPLKLLAYMQDKPDPKALLDLLSQGFPGSSSKDLSLLVDLLEEDLLLKLIKKRPDLSLLAQKADLPSPCLIKLLRTYYRGQDFFMVDQVLNKLHHKDGSMPTKDLKVYYLLSLTRPIPLPAHRKPQIEGLLKEDTYFSCLTQAFLGKREDLLTKNLAHAFPDPKDQDLLAQAFTQLS